MSKRVDAMDLLRAVAILMVLLAHAVFTYGAPDYIAPLQIFGMGVDLFFVLSGWLLGSALIKERKRAGRIDVKNFWIRRWFRTFPAYYAVLALLTLQQYLVNPDFTIDWSYVFFYQNYQMPLEYFSISWSLAVEEQFYLVIAPLLLLLGKWGRKFETSILLLLALSPFVLRYLGWYEHTKQTHVRLDCCAVGVLLAHVYYTYQSVWNSLRAKAFSIAILLSLIVAGFLVARYISTYDAVSPDYLLLAITFGFWVVWANTTTVEFNRHFKSAFYYVSTRSYSMYLLHPEALALTKKVMVDAPFVLYFGFMFAVTCLLSEALYRVVEQPFLRLRDRDWSFFKTQKGVNKCVELPD